MDDLEMRDLLAKRLYLELQLFKSDTLRQTKEDIYNTSYKIEVFVNAYEALLESVENLNDQTVCKLIHWDGGILEFLYQEWLTKQDCIFDELKAYIAGELENMTQSEQMDYGKEKIEDGTRADKIAQSK